MSVLNLNEQRAGIPVMCAVWDVNTLDWVRMVQPTGGGGGGTQDTRETRPANAACANVAASVTNVTLLASNSSRRAATFFNDSASATLYLKFGATASTSSFTVKLVPGAYFEIPQPCYSGIVDGLYDAAIGACRVTEVTD
jgi:hypothetical protein